MNSHPKILFFDIETSPMQVFAWALFDQNIPLNQIKKDWFVLSWSAKWAHQDKVIYQDLRQGKKSFSAKNEKKLLQGIWKLLDEADIVVSQNGIKFDSKKLNTRFIFHKMKPPSSYKHFDTLKTAKKHFAFTSNKLEYLAEFLNVPFKKLKHKKFPGFDLWNECLLNNNEAWKEMELYNRNDTLTLIGVYHALSPWEPGIFDVQSYTGVLECKCGSKNYIKYGYAYTGKTKYQRLKCKNCGSETRGEKVKSDD